MASGCAQDDEHRTTRRVRVVAGLLAVVAAGTLSACGAHPTDSAGSCPAPKRPDGGTSVTVSGRYGASAGGSKIGLLSISSDMCSAVVVVGPDLVSRRERTVRVGQLFDVGTAKAMVIETMFHKDDLPVNGGETASVWISDLWATEQLH